VGFHAAGGFGNAAIDVDVRAAVAVDRQVGIERRIEERAALGIGQIGVVGRDRERVAAVAVGASVCTVLLR
jgi:hypothetical protein